jgi:hypothetical protein
MELSKIGEVILSKSFFLNSAILTVLVRLVWSVISVLLNKIRYLWMKKVQSFVIPLESSETIDSLTRFYCLVIRYGTDNYIRDMANDQEKYDGRLQNKIIPINVRKDKENNLSLKLKLPVHKRIGTQFKCFAEVQDSRKVDELCSILEKCRRVYDISKSSSQFKNRIYFLLQDFGTVKTVEGIENNMCFPT